MILIPTDFEHDMTPLSVQLTSILALQFLPDILVQLRSLLFVGQSLYRLLILSGSTNLLLPPLLGVDINIPASHLNPLPTVRLLCWFNQIFLLLNNIYFCRLNRKQISKSIYIDQHFISLAKFDRITILLQEEGYPHTNSGLSEFSLSNLPILVKSSESVSLNTQMFPIPVRSA